MTLHDISLTISEAFPTWPGDPPIELTRISSLAAGDQANVTLLRAPVHAATHVDAPDHFLGDGRTVETIPLELMVGPALVVEMASSQLISAADLAQAGIPKGTRRVLFKTSNSQIWSAGQLAFREDFVALAPDAAQALVKLGVEVVGVDYLSVSSFSDPLPTHQILLEAGILIIEGLDLSKIQPGEYRLYCLPLKIAGSDGAPARVLLED